MPLGAAIPPLNLPGVVSATIRRMGGARFEVAANGVTLAGERWDGEGTPVVLLHAGVADRRAWREVAPQLSAPAIAYDRRGFGESPATPPPYTHLEDLVAVLDAVGGRAGVARRQLDGRRARARRRALASPSGWPGSC